MNDEVPRFPSRLADWLADTQNADTALALLATAEKLLADDRVATVDTATWQRFLDETRKTRFLRALPDAAARTRWAETSFQLLRATDYGLETIFEQRVGEHPDLTFLREFGPDDRHWSYELVFQKVRSIAAAFWAAWPEPPRVAIVSENSFDSACCDLACLCYDIFVTPLSPHFDSETLGWIFDELSINTVIAGSDESLARLQTARTLTTRPFHLFSLNEEEPVASDGPESRLAEATARLGRAEIDRILAGRVRRNIMDVATVMFTSGSTGRPKGVQYTIYNLVTKRFARAAALPHVGENETLFAFLPLFHTFGRYLEMLGMLFWGGTYVFAGNPSLETLLAGLREVQPTGLISIPRRWQQIRERCLEGMDSTQDATGRAAAFREVVGNRLRWGLSAAGALEPAAFHFFQRHGVELCSGFGMTEATGGITMTPPGEYEDGSVGAPLPGIRVRLDEIGEMQIAGHYVARYLGDPPPSPDDEYWLPTGDIFRRRVSGHYEIIDRIKDIYKNSKGQTVAPGAIEQKLANVPGIARSFLVGDGKDYNVLLIVPDPADPVLGGDPDSDTARQYFQQIVATANQGLAPFERVVNFAVLDRDFDQQRGELTPKGSYQRKTIEKNFRETVESLYQRNIVELELDRVTIQIPRWFFRDLGILESDIVARADGLLNQRNQQFLAVAHRAETGLVQIGDLEYSVKRPVVNLGLLARQPMLWLANPALIAFCPCKEGWDVPTAEISPQIMIPYRDQGDFVRVATATPTTVRDPAVVEVNSLCTTALFAPSPTALGALRELKLLLKRTSHRLGKAIHRRIEALARHPELEVRTTAYEIFLLSGRMPDYSREIPPFLLSGLPFLSEKSIKAIADAGIERVRLDALRRRLHRYRAELSWPGHPALRTQMESVFALLESFVQRNPEYYAEIRAELVLWVLHDADPELARSARHHLDRTVARYSKYLERTTENNEPERWVGTIAFQDRITEEEIGLLEKALVGTTFLKQTIMLALGEKGIDVDEIPANGIWIARVFSFLRNRVYRVSVNTRNEKHFDLLIGTVDATERETVLETVFWVIALGGLVEETPVLRPFGCYRPELGAFSMAIVDDLTVWERVRELTGESYFEFTPSNRHWQDLFTRGMAAFFTGWKHSDGRIVPGPVTPANVVVPARDYRAGDVILFLADRRPYTGPLSLVRPMIRNFYLPTVSYYPDTRKILDIDWIFDAAMEALGANQGKAFLEELRAELSYRPDPELDRAWQLTDKLDPFLARLEAEYRLPLPLQGAIERYASWEESNPRATPFARERQITDLHRLYRLESYADIGRYSLYRHTYFAGFSPDVRSAFERLLHKMFRQPKLKPTHMVELSELQHTLSREADRLVFSRMVFPTGRSTAPVDVIAVGDRLRGQVVVMSHVRDHRGDTYTIREPVDPAEIGRLYRLFLEAGMPMNLSDHAQYLLAIDSDDRIVGGVCHFVVSPTVAHMDGMVITEQLRGRGVGGELLENFCSRLASQGIHALSTHFVSRRFLKNHKFQVDQEWGGLVRFLGIAAQAEPKRPISTAAS